MGSSMVLLWGLYGALWVLWVDLVSLGSLWVHMSSSMVPLLGLYGALWVHMGPPPVAMAPAMESMGLSARYGSHFVSLWVSMGLYAPH